MVGKKEEKGDKAKGNKGSRAAGEEGLLCFAFSFIFLFVNVSASGMGEGGGGDGNWGGGRRGRLRATPQGRTHGHAAVGRVLAFISCPICVFNLFVFFPHSVFHNAEIRSYTPLSRVTGLTTGRNHVNGAEIIMIFWLIMCDGILVRTGKSSFVYHYPWIYLDRDFFLSKILFLRNWFLKIWYLEIIFYIFHQSRKNILLENNLFLVEHLVS